MKSKIIFIGGLGISGYEAALLALSKNYKVSVFDSRVSKSLEERADELRELGAEIFLNHTFSETALNADFFVISPGIHPKSGFGCWINSHSCPVISELEFAASLTDIPLIGITGTNGKTTTTELITHCLNKMGSKAIAAGNIGKALSCVVRENKAWDYIVVEVSSFQLECIDQLKFVCGLLLNIESDHIDRYDYENDYALAKIRLLKHSTKVVSSLSCLSHDAWDDDLNQNIFVTSIDPVAEKENSVTINSLIQATLTSKTEMDFTGNHFELSAHPLQGIHNAQNIMSCMAVLHLLGFAKDEVFKASLTYRAAPHRMQNFLHYKKIRFINDSKATNPHAMLMALKSLGNKEKKNLVLIAGGRDKKMDFNIVNSSLSSYVRAIFIYGECRQKLFDSWKDVTSCQTYESFDESVGAALLTVKEGDTLLLSPGCASFDCFKSYAHRGEEFISSVLEWRKNEQNI
ncbi:MAG: UDP-N-acetylmuramoyl-L-alanine--D-glutamate ligase [Lentisphaeraceae bacterium]|nr:UDP-N-acetylmuramoyl-L-alanine--D-glutamate ligase [Lentisphaeraceae bacterium]